MNLDKLIRRATKLRKEGISLEELLATLRAEGVGIIDSVKIVCAVEGIDLGQAKVTIDDSATWADRREATEHARSLAEQSLQLDDPSDECEIVEKDR